MTFISRMPVFQLHSSPAYTRIALLLHWAMALLLLLNFGLSLFMEAPPKNTSSRDAVLFYHASFSSLLFMLAVGRLSWRCTHRPDPLPDSVAPLYAAAAHTLHWILYALMLVIPATCYVHRLAGAHPVNFFGLGNLPVFLAWNEPLRLLTDTLHYGLVCVLAALFLAHLAAALKHRRLDCDGVAERMMRLPQAHATCPYSHALNP